MARKKNPFGKSNFDAPHAIYEGDGPWGHAIIHVIKTYQHPDNERKNRYARWLIGAKTDMTFGSFDYGDTYVSEALIGDMKLVQEFYSSILLDISKALCYNKFPNGIKGLL